MDTDTAKQGILIIDDTPLQIRILSQILAPLYEVKIAKSGEKGLELARKHNVDLILLDIVMTGMSGFEVLAELKESSATKHIPVIFITSMDSSEGEVRGLSLGAVDYITKPFVDEIVRLRVGLHMQLISQMRTIERLGLFDSLTGVRNRHSFNSRMQSEWDAAIQNKTCMSMLMLDIDHFKAFNDKYGHLGGDLCLKAVAGIFKDTVTRGEDFVFRWGGEEFAILLPGFPLEDAAGVAENVRHNVESAMVSCGEGIIAKVTVSIGVGTVFPQPGDRIEKFCDDTDKALYKAKQGGRNRVEAAANE
ncbi:MAG: diguanylate cyclase [Treponema sp.]|nr:diguanylate cyclase [Treponema sp.]